MRGDVNRRLAELFQAGLLLGDLVIAATGSDLDVRREPAPGDHEDSAGFRLRHRAWLQSNGTEIGRAAAWWRGPEAAWAAIEHIRMKNLLDRRGYAVRSCRLHELSGFLERVLESPGEDGVLRITEEIQLDPLAALLPDPPPTPLRELFERFGGPFHTGRQ